MRTTQRDISENPTRLVDAPDGNGVVGQVQDVSGWLTATKVCATKAEANQALQAAGYRLVAET